MERNSRGNSDQSSQARDCLLNQWNGWKNQRFATASYGQHNTSRNPSGKKGKNLTQRKSASVSEHVFAIESDRNFIRNREHGYSQVNKTNRGTAKRKNHSTEASLNIEWDCIDSFHEFAVFMDKINPICPAEHLDTPEKLMKMLVF